jgi:hypothetical protein
MPGSCEAAVHATRSLIAKMSVDDALAKLDFLNALNCLHKDLMLKTVAEELPCFHRFYHLAYGYGTSHVLKMILNGLYRAFSKEIS